MITIEVCYRKVYGKAMCYPLNEAAHILVQLARGPARPRGDGRETAKTLTERDLELAEKMGMDVTVLPDPELGRNLPTR